MYAVAIAIGKLVISRWSLKILSSFSNFYQVMVDQVPETEYADQLVNWSSVISRWSLKILSSFSNIR